jgi:hypothetical protein
MIRLLGLRATEAFSHSAEATALINQVENSLRLWATSFLKKDEAGVQALSHFLAADVGRTFRLEGVLWLLKAIQQPARISQTTGEVLAETMSVLLEQHPKDLLIRDDVRDAVAAIILRLVADEVPIGLALQQRMAALR